ncbi:LacI family DNA-binding transcriptional regulator [uncultured Sphaerochaeta sp.]|uniref:LacI family DNA-binding transcriptional regulator n=1 Tax=uncultured Sphaerochaeta sp. TaxID=886478 RepID=UPI002A0A3FDA|nr:LacI family DNA-binding transcriptional regulator [uncultured Sphaerochaeta sp.]
MVTLKDIGHKVNRSVTTVSRALAGCSDVSPDTILIVRKAAEEMGYFPNTLAQRLQKQSADTIGVIAPVSSKGYAESFFCEFLAGIGEEASNQGIDLLVAYAQEEDELSNYRKLISGRRVDGFILSRTLRDDPRVQFLNSLQFPFAAFGMIEGTSSLPYVEEDGEYAMGLVVEHLVSKGHTRIACICPPLSVLFAAKRLSGVQAKMKQLGLVLDPQLIREGSFDQKDGYEQTKSLLSLPNPPTAIIGFNDIIAFGAINAAKEQGLKIGKDLAVTGFDDIPMASMYRPALTTIRQPIREIGKMVTKLLLDTIKEKNAGIVLPEEALKDRQILLKPELIIRKST